MSCEIPRLKHNRQHDRCMYIGPLPHHGKTATSRLCGMSRDSSAVPFCPRDHAGAAVVCAYRACLLSSSQNSTARDAHFRWSLIWQAGRVSASVVTRKFSDLNFGATCEGVDLSATIGRLKYYTLRGGALKRSLLVYT